MRRPDIHIVGAPKCGTTAMFDYLGQHPEIYAPPDKDRRFFGQDLAFKDRLDLEGYLARYAGWGDEPHAVDASVYNLLSTTAAREIKAFCPQAHAVIMLRNPVDMLYSHHSQLLYNGYGDEDIRDFAEALAAEPDRAAGRRIPEGTTLPEALLYRRLARYDEQVARYQEVFDPDHLHVILYDDFKADTLGTTRWLYARLGVDPEFTPDIRVVNPNTRVRSEAFRRLLRAIPEPVKARALGRARPAISAALRRLNTRVEPRPPLDPDLRRRLVEEFRPEVERLAARIDRDLSAWTVP